MSRARWKRSLTRRTILKTAALTPPALAAGSLPFVHGAYAAGKLSIGAWDHWVPGATQVLEKMCQEWAAKEKVELTFDAITSNGDKDLLTLMAEGQARAGHDMMGLRTWYVSAQAERFVPVEVFAWTVSTWVAVPFAVIDEEVGVNVD